MDPSAISAFSGLAGAAIGGLTAFGTGWATQEVQLRAKRVELAATTREVLFSEFISEASRLYGDALTHEKGNVTDLVHLYALAARLRLIASSAVIVAAEGVIELIVQTYFLPNQSLDDIQNRAKLGEFTFLIEFSEACRRELAAFNRIIPG